MTEDTLQVRLAYGEEGLDVDLPAGRTTVVEPTYVAAPRTRPALLRDALRDPVAGPPLRELVRPGPDRGDLDVRRHPAAAAPPDDPGRARGARRDRPTSRTSSCWSPPAPTAATPRRRSGRCSGDEVADRVRVVNHDARDDSSLVYLGRHGDDVPVFLNRLWVEADVRITTGFVEPHFFAGFSGGPKLVAPGLAGLETVLTLHDAQRIGDPRATWGGLRGQPGARRHPGRGRGRGRVDFALDVVLNREQRIVEAFGGSLPEMHAAAREASRRLAMQPVPALFDVVVTTNAGYPARPEPLPGGEGDVGRR